MSLYGLKFATAKYLETAEEIEFRGKSPGDIVIATLYRVVLREPAPNSAFRLSVLYRCTTTPQRDHVTS